MTDLHSTSNKAVWHALGSRYAMMLASLGVVWLNSHFLGTSGLGTIALINAGILLQVMISGCVAGGALVFLAPRMGMQRLLGAGMLWMLVSVAITAVVFIVAGIVPAEWRLHTLALGLLQSAFFFLQQLVLGQERIRHYNYLLAFQPLSLLFLLLMFYIGYHDVSVMAFVICLYLSFIATLFVTVRRWGVKQLQVELAGWRNTIVEVLRFGWKAQAGNLFHLINLRGPSVLLEHSLANARPLIGVLALGLYACEAVWNVAKSLSTVQYARIANMQETTEMKALTRAYMRRSVLFTSVAALVVALFPDAWYGAILRTDVGGLHTVMLCLLPALLANSTSIILAHYFSGRGAYHITMKASLVGLIPAMAFGFLFIPAYGLNAATAMVSIALVVQSAVLWWWYRKGDVIPPSRIVL
jgi:O-antigen/teichoic acid export membrane protein